MPTKRRVSGPRTTRPRRATSEGDPLAAQRLRQLYPSLAEGLTPEQRLAKLLKEARARGARPLTPADLEAMGDVWPPEEDLDAFLTWLRQSRREGRY
jgi:hypothetical protein